MKERDAAAEKAAALKVFSDPPAVPVEPQSGASSSEGVSTGQKEGES